MMAHDQNTERLQALLKKHQSENTPTSHWVSLTSRGETWESLPCSDWPTSECTVLSTGSRSLLTCIPLHRLRGAGFTLLNAVIFNIFLLFFPRLKINKTEEVLLPGFPHEPAPPPCPRRRHPSDLQLSAPQRLHQLNYWGRQEAPSTSIADAQLPTGLSEGHKRPNLRLLAAWRYSGKPPTGLMVLCANMEKEQNSVCRKFGK